ncbi:MAG: ABC transporter permease [Cypionkella sp.]
MLNFKKDIGLFSLIMVVGAVVAFINPRFLSAINIANTANLVGLFGVFSIAEGLVIITGGIDLAAGSAIALLGVVFVDLITTKAVPWPLAALIVLVLGAGMGLVNGLLITKKKLQPFVVTLCGLLIYRGVARFYTADATAGFDYDTRFDLLEFLTTGRTDVVALLSGGKFSSIAMPHSFVFLMVLAAVMWVVLHRSAFGRYLYAVGKNEEAARFSGIRTDRVIIAAYVICSVLTAVSAIFLAMYTRSILPSSHGNFYELYAIAAAVLGGFSLRGGDGSIIGVVLGTILLQVLQNLVNLLGIPSSLNFAVSGSVILIGVLADQEFAAYRERREKLRNRQSAGGH